MRVHRGVNYESKSRLPLENEFFLLFLTQKCIPRKERGKCVRLNRLNEWVQGRVNFGSQQITRTATGQCYWACQLKRVKSVFSSGEREKWNSRWCDIGSIGNLLLVLLTLPKISPRVVQVKLNFSFSPIWSIAKEFPWNSLSLINTCASASWVQLII